MSYQYYDQADRYGGSGIPYYPSEPASRQPRQMPQGQQRRGAPPMPGYGQQRPVRPGNAFAAGHAGELRRQPPPPAPMESTENLYDGSGYGEDDYESDQWPLPAPSRAYEPPQGRSGSLSSPGRQQQQSPNQRRPPQRPQRPDYQPPPRPGYPPPQRPDYPSPQRPEYPPPQQPITDLPRARVAPAASNRQYHQPSPPQQIMHYGSGHWTGDSYSPPSGYPPANLPLPQPQFTQGAYGMANNRPPLGPPPSARRGPSSYYPQVAPVHPIVEETDSMRGSIRNIGHDSMKSYASSNAIPIGIPDYYLHGSGSGLSVPGASRPISVPDSVYSDDPTLSEPPALPPPLHVAHAERDVSPVESDFSEQDHGREEPSSEPAALVRQASLGRKSRPTLTTVRSGEKMRKVSAAALAGAKGLSSLPSQRPKDPVSAAKQIPVVKQTPPPEEDSEEEDGISDPEKEGQFGHSDKALEAGAAAAAAPVMSANVKQLRDDMPHRTPNSDILSSGTGLLDASSSESENGVKKRSSRDILGLSMPKFQRQDSSNKRDVSPLSNEVEIDPRMSEILGGLEKGGAIAPSNVEAGAESNNLKVPGRGFSARAGKKRPPRLNVDAVRDAEARGSMTSLPDLIKRATKLASNLDRGKTASRLGMNWFDGMTAEEVEKYSRSNGDKRHSGVSDILASFPPAGYATPSGSRGGDALRRSYTNWSSNLRHSHLPSEPDVDQERKGGKRRCCGMPLWLFLLLLLVLMLLIAAAIVVPVVLVVVPKQNSSTSLSDDAQQTCEADLQCQNGGASILTSAGSCKCLCVNGYLGTTCGTASGAGCTSTSVGSTSNVTVGQDIPRLLSGATSKYSVPLDGQTLLGLFNGANMTCNEENELVTFDSSAEKRRWMLDESSPVVKRQASSTASSGDAAATSDGIVYETGSPSATASANPTATSASTGSASSSPSVSSSSSSNGTASSPTDLDFARIAVLYVFQASGELADAEAAQTNLEEFFSGGTPSTGQTVNTSSIDLGGGYTCDLTGLTISLSNGTTVGGST